MNRLLAALTAAMLGSAALQAAAPYATPYYFGPNALPVPEMAERPSDRIRAEAGTRLYFGHRGGTTVNTNVRVVVPLWSDRVNLVSWANIREFYWDVDPVLIPPGMSLEQYKRSRPGSTPGDIYVSTDMLVVRESEYAPDLIMRATLKTASGDDYETARHFDSAAYYFDFTGAKTFSFGEFSLRPSVNVGFMCWQIGINRQDDALMTGVQLGADWRGWSLKSDLSGYAGRLHSNDPQAHDRPAVVRGALSRELGRCVLTGSWEHGLRDFPYNSFGLMFAVKI